VAPADDLAIGSGAAEAAVAQFRRQAAHTMQDSDPKDMFDPSYSATDFRVQLAGGQLRWFATILAVVSIGLFVYLVTQGEKAELDFPFHITGQAALWVAGVAFVVWAAIAITNWRAWIRRKNGAA
jgi:hypothetical protein